MYGKKWPQYLKGGSISSTLEDIKKQGKELNTSTIQKFLLDL